MLSEKILYLKIEKTFLVEKLFTDKTKNAQHGKTIYNN